MQTNININVADLTLNNRLIFEHENTRVIITKEDANNPNPFEEHQNTSSIWDMTVFLVVFVTVILIISYAAA